MEGPILRPSTYSVADGMELNWILKRLGALGAGVGSGFFSAIGFSAVGFSAIGAGASAATVACGCGCGGAGGCCGGAGSALVEAGSWPTTGLGKSSGAGTPAVGTRAGIRAGLGATVVLWLRKSATPTAEATTTSPRVIGSQPLLLRGRTCTPVLPSA